MKIRGRMIIIRHWIFSFFFSRETQKILKNPDISDFEQRRERVLEWINKRSYDVIKSGVDGKISDEEFKKETEKLHEMLDLLKR
tara:strand:- start:7 stop:258 length:252 start_codon:yes stop_codon:yes gene_type:complete